MRESAVHDRTSRNGTFQNRPIVFIGMMGSGKTTIGRSVAKRLGLRFLDNDAEISRRTNRRVADLVREDEQAFRQMEEQLIKEALDTEDRFVFSLGGGAIMRNSTRVLLKDKATVVWLNSSHDVLSRRVARRLKERPMLDGDADEHMRTLLASREPLYKECADITIDSGDGSREQVVSRIARMLR